MAPSVTDRTIPGWLMLWSQYDTKSNPSPQRGATEGVSFDDQALADQLRHADPGRYRPGRLSIRVCHARGRYEALRRQTGVPLLWPNAHLCRYRPIVAQFRGVPADHARRQKGRPHRGNVAEPAGVSA